MKITRDVELKLSSFRSPALPHNRLINGVEVSNKHSNWLFSFLIGRLLCTLIGLTARKFLPSLVYRRINSS